MKWPEIPLGEVVRHRKEFITIDDLETYKRCRVQLHVQGIVLRDAVVGAEIKTKKQQVCRADEFLVAEIDAKVGGFGIVPSGLDGAIVSSHYFLFTIDKERLDPRFLNYFIRTPAFTEQVSARGSTNYAAIRPEHILKYRIPLPPLPEQRRIVEYIENLASRIYEGIDTARKSTIEIHSLPVVMAHRLDLSVDDRIAFGWRLIRLGDVLKETNDLHRVEAEKTYPNLGIYSFGRGLFRKNAIDGVMTGATHLRRVRSGQFIYSRLFAFEGAYGRVTPDFDGYFVSNEYPTFECNTDQINIEFLNAYFRMPSIWKQVAMGSKGLGDRRQRVQPERILNHQLYLPPIKWQEKIKSTMLQAEGAKPMIDRISAELDALLPSILDKAFKCEL